MVVLNSLKILSSETRHTLSVVYVPAGEIRKAFILPPSISVNVEVFPISEVGVFARSEPVFFIDGYIGCTDGKPCIAPCGADGFVQPNWFDLVAANDSLTLERTAACIEENIDTIVESAMRKSEAAQFGIQNPVCLRLAVFFIKINQLDDALKCIRENMPTTYSLEKIIPYLTYEIFAGALLAPEDPSIVDSIAYISTALTGAQPSSEENRVLNTVLVGLQKTSCRRPPSILNMYSRVAVSPHKASMFYYLLSLYIGPEYATRYTLVGLAVDRIGCSMCSPSRMKSSKKTLESIISLESDLVVEKTPCDLVLAEYMHNKSVIPDPEIYITTGIGEYITQTKQEIESTETKDVHMLSELAQTEAGAPGRAIYTEGEVSLKVGAPDVAVTGILLGRPTSETTVVSAHPLHTRPKELQCLAPTHAGEKATFFISSTCKILEVYLSYKGRSYSKKVHVSVEVLEVPLSKKVLSHRLSIVPGAGLLESSETKEIELCLGRCIGSPFSVVSFSPLRARIPFMHNGCTLYTEAAFSWEYLDLVKVKESADAYDIQALGNDLVIEYAGASVRIQAHTSKKVAKDAKTKKMFWMLADRTKSGEVSL
ncbi:uncharacterized protein NEMAJ01_1242 [Nematocida major]|uniref:uncharacterized protein n=1 Tax=Nematocida major TaxID=1912982 RepID=UPI002007C31A|nr:uncharacterized protein NEMAJ01_1242 [Nematocida major]KAH9386346.1 hypothetical protein NEMAJ01_1242 [Nematocida major]